jgi:protein SCO1/2
LNPEGEFVTFYGKNTTEKEVIASVRGHIEAYENQ